MGDVRKHHGSGNTLYRQVHGKWTWSIKGVPTTIPAFISTRPTQGSKSIELVVREQGDQAPVYWSPELAESVSKLVGASSIDRVVFDPRGDPDATPLLDLLIIDGTYQLVKAATIKVTLLGTGSENQQERAPAGLLVQVGNRSFVFDGGRDLLSKLPRSIDAWFVTDPQHENMAVIKEQAETLGTSVMAGCEGDYHQDNLSVRSWSTDYVHEGTVVYEIYVTEDQPNGTSRRTLVVWAPRMSKVDSWVFQDADLSFVGVHGWSEPMYGPDGKTMFPALLPSSEELKSHGAKKVVFVNLDADILEKFKQSSLVDAYPLYFVEPLLFGELGLDGQMFSLTTSSSASDAGHVSVAKDAKQEFEYDVIQKAVEQQYTFGVCYKATNVVRDPELDAHDEFIMADELQKGQWGYVQTGDRRIYLQHGDLGIVPVGEWVDIVAWPWEVTAKLTLPNGVSKESTIPANSVWMGVLWNEVGWKLVKTGKIRGLSMGGFAHRTKVTTK